MNNAYIIQILSYYRNTFAQIELVEDKPIGCLFIDIESEYLVTALDKVIALLNRTEGREVFDESFHII